MTYFYGRLFAADPEIRAMFPATMAVQRRRFYDALCRIAASAAGPDGTDPRLDEYLGGLGRAHRRFGVRKEHYDAFAEALAATFKRYPPDASGWRETEWAAAFDRAISVMITAAEADAASAPAWWTAEITANEPRTPDIAVLTVRPDRPFPYRPGQHVALQTPRWPRVWRTYSIANAPVGEQDELGELGEPDDALTLHVRAIPGGLVSTTLVHAEPGDTLVLGAAEGTMTADTESGRDVLCLAGGTGLAPLKAITAAIARSARPGRRPEIGLYFGARTEAELYDLPALRAMELDYPWLRVHPATSEEDAPEALHNTIPGLVGSTGWRDRDIYVSGPDAMIVATVRRLRELGAPAERLHYDLPAGIVALRRAARGEHTADGALADGQHPRVVRGEREEHQPQRQRPAAGARPQRRPRRTAARLVSTTGSRSPSATPR